MRPQRDSGSAIDQIALIEGKLEAPRPRAATLRRRRVMRRLDRASATAVTLVSAPAGYGKTVAVAAWVAAQPTCCAWVSVDEADNDPVRLWAHIVAAISSAMGGEAIAGLAKSALRSGAVELLVDELFAAVRVDGRRLVIVLDDLHLIEDEPCLRSLEFAIRLLPPEVALIVITRRDPRLRLERLRGQGALVEVRAGDLAFDIEEARRLLVDLDHVELRDGDLKLLMARTEGWPAALRLASLWLREAGDPKHAVALFAGHTRPVSTYLAHEVLAGLDAEIRAFLLETSVLSRFNAELCDYVRGRNDSRAFLERAAARNLFLLSVDSDGIWYRYHALCAELLTFELSAQSSASETDLRERAARWFRDHGLVDEAAEQASATGDHEFIARLLDDHHLQLFRTGRMATLARWADQLPAEMLAARPGVLIARALLTGATAMSPASTHRLLTAAQRSRDERLETWTPYQRAALDMLLAFHTDAVAPAIGFARRSVAVADQGAEDLIEVASAILAQELMLAGNLDDAEHAATRAVAHPLPLARPYAYVSGASTLASIAVQQGLLERARDYARSALSTAREAGIADGPFGARAYLAVAETDLADGRLSAAQAAAETAAGLQGATSATMRAWIQIVMATICVRRGALRRAEQLLREIHALINQCEDPGALPTLAAHVQRELAIAGTRTVERQPHEPVSTAERAVLAQLPTELNTRQIAEQLHLSVNTVRSHVRSIYRKLGVNSREAALAEANRQQLLEQIHLDETAN